MRWPKGPPHLALNPPYFFFCFFLFCFFLLVCFLFSFWRVKGQVRWLKGPPHLALNPPYLFFFVVLFFLGFFLYSFFWLFNTKKPCVPPRKGHFCLFSVFLFLSPLAFFGLPLFCFSLSVSLFCYFLSFFLLVFAFCFLFVSCFCLFLCFAFFFAFVSWNKQHQQNSVATFFSCNFFLFLVSCLVFSLKSLFLIFVSFLVFSSVVCSTSIFWFHKTQVEKHQFWVKRGVATKRVFFINLCFEKCQKLSFFLGPFFGNFWLMFKKPYKNRYFNTFSKAKIWKKMAIFNSY